MSELKWTDYADSPQEFLQNLETAEWTIATPEEMKRGIAAHIKLAPYKKNLTDTDLKKS